MTSTIPSFLSSNGLSRAKAHAAYPQVISRSFRDEDRSFKGVEANLSILRQRIEVIGSKEKLERCYKFQQQGWNYISEYNEKHKRDKMVLESFEVAGLVGWNLSLVFLTGSFCIFLVSFIAHIHA
nr:Increased rDNA silencing protein [Ipomoea batatas]